MASAKHPIVLLVEKDAETRSAMARWINHEGYPCLTCPGPQAPTYHCPGIVGACPLAEAADICVLDMETGGDVNLKGASGWEIMLAYLALGKAVVALVGPNDATHPDAGDRVTVLPRPVGRDDLMVTLDGIIRRRRSVEADDRQLPDLAD